MSSNIPTEIVIETLPLFEMARMRSANTARKHPINGFAGDGPDSTMRWVNQFTHTRRLLGPNDREVVTPNNDTLYTNAWLDLSLGPLIITVPEMGERYWTLGFLDAWTNPWAYAGKRTTGGKAQKIFIHGPRWSGDVPQGMHCISSPGEDVWIIGRILVDPNAHDLACVHELQDQFAILDLNGKAALSRIDVLLDGRKTDVPTASDYVSVLDEMLRRNPPENRIEGWPIQADALQAALFHVYGALRESSAGSDLGGGWHMAVAVRTHFGNDYLTRARVARNWIGTLGVEEAMYIMAEVDSEGEVLTGAHAYELKFESENLPRVDAFWSITLYRRSDCLLVSNEINRYSIGDRTAELRFDEDASLSIRVQSRNPDDNKNWLPAPEGEPFYLALRLYQPQKDHLEGDFKYPALRRLD